GAGSFAITLTNPDAKASNALSGFSIFLPTLSSVVPNNITENTAVTLALSGTDFVTGATVKIGTATFTPSAVTPTSITLPLTASQVTSLGLGSKTLVVVNPAGGTSNGLSLSVNPASVSAPTGLTATVAGTTIQLAWVDAATNEVNYIVERSTDNITFTPLTSTLPEGTQSYSDTGLAPGTYYYRVAAKSASVQSDYSNVASGVIGEDPSEASPVDDIISFTSSTGGQLTFPTNSSLDVSFTATSLVSGSGGYNKVKTLAVVALCRLDDPDPADSAICAGLDYSSMVDALFVTEVPAVTSLFLGKSSYNFNSLYPNPFGNSGKIEIGTFVLESGSSFVHSVVPSSAGLVPGQYRLLGVALASKFDYDPLGDGVEVKVEADVSNNFSSLVLVVTDGSSTPPEGDSDPSSGGGSPSSGGGGGGGSGGGGGGGGGSVLNDQTTEGPLLCVPSVELCNGFDDDCDGVSDEGCFASESDACTNGVQDAGELGVDCGGTCSTFCAQSVPESAGLFFFAALNPIILLFQALLRLLGF
ncbi:MAG: fibronectin type III domain-containing protein, partial [archaeon]